MTADLSVLIARLEAAEVGSREMDCEIYAIENPHMKPVRSQVGRFFDPKRANEHSAEKYHISGGATGTAPRYTTSLDAALALAERVLPKDTFWEMGHNAVINGQRMYHADVFPPYQSGEATFWGYGPYPALALVIAILRAKQGEKT